MVELCGTSSCVRQCRVFEAAIQQMLAATSITNGHTSPASAAPLKDVANNNKIAIVSHLDFDQGRWQSVAHSTLTTTCCEPTLAYRQMPKLVYCRQ